MSAKVLETLVEGYCATDQDQYVFCWQGGEPALMGLDFFRMVTDLQAGCARKGSRIANGISTNALLIDDELADHFSRYKFLVGVSLDGQAGIHDAHRVTPDGRGSHADVIKAIRRLERHGIDINALALVTTRNVEQGTDVYRHLRDLGILHHQYIPCVEIDNAGKPLPFTISGEQWGRFLLDVFDQWLRADVHRVSVRNFDVPLQALWDGSATVCTASRRCDQYLVVEHNGDVYPCDFYVQESLRLGNIIKDTWEKILCSERYRAFARQKSRWSKACETCEYLSLCAGDCPRHRVSLPGNPRGVSWLCPGWRMFYRRAVPELLKLAEWPRKGWDPGPRGALDRGNRACGITTRSITVRGITQPGA